VSTRAPPLALLQERRAKVFKCDRRWFSKRLKDASAFRGYECNLSPSRTARFKRASSNTWSVVTPMPARNILSTLPPDALAAVPNDRRESSRVR